MSIYKKYRKARGITQKRMAELLDINLNTYRNYELGLRVMPYEVLIDFLRLRGEVDDLKLANLLEELYDFSQTNTF